MKENHQMNLFDKKTVGFTIGLVLLILGCFMVFTIFGTHLWKVENSGEVGDIIGGISGPIISIFGAILIYKSFLVQLEANKIQADNFLKDKEFRELWELYKDTKNDFISLDFISPENGITYNGMHALEKYYKRLCITFVQTQSERGFMIYNISGIVLGVLLTIRKIHASRLEKNEKELLISKIALIYDQRFSDIIGQILFQFQDKGVEADLVKKINEANKEIKANLKMEVHNG